MNDRQLVEALRAIGDRPAVPDADFGDRLWQRLPAGRREHGRTGRPGLLLVAALLALLAVAVSAAVGARLVDRRPLMDASLDPSPAPAVADATPATAPAVPPPSTPAYAVDIPDGMATTSTVDAIATAALAIDDVDLGLDGGETEIQEITLLEPGTRFPDPSGTMVSSERPVWAVSVRNPRYGSVVVVYIIDGTMAVAGVERADPEPAATIEVLPTWDPAVPLQLVGEAGRTIRPLRVPILGPGLPFSAGAPVAIGDVVWVLLTPVYTEEEAALVRIDARSGAMSRVALPDSVRFGQLVAWRDQLWVSTGAIAHELDPADGTVRRSVAAPPEGGLVGVDGDGLWFRVLDGIALVDPDTGHEIRRIATPETGDHSYRGIWEPPAFGSIWDVHRGTGTLYRLDRVTGETVATIDLPTDDPESCSDPRPLIGIRGEPALVLVRCRYRQYLIDPGTNTLRQTVATEGSLFVVAGQLWTTRTAKSVAWREPGALGRIDLATGREVEVLTFSRDRTAGLSAIVAGESVWVLVGEVAKRDQGYDHNTALIKIPVTELEP